MSDDATASKSAQRKKGGSFQTVSYMHKVRVQGCFHFPQCLRVSPDDYGLSAIFFFFMEKPKAWTNYSKYTQQNLLGSYNYIFERKYMKIVIYISIL